MEVIDKNTIREARMKEEREFRELQNLMKKENKKRAEDNLKELIEHIKSHVK